MKRVTITAAVVMCVIIVGMFLINAQEGSTNITKDQTKVGVILNTSKDDKSWGQSHYEGMEKTARELNLSVTYCEEVPETPKCEGIIDSLIADGCRIIISASSGYAESALKCAEKHPDVYFFQISGEDTRENLATFFGRIYQVRYLSGIVAGMQSETDEIGYVAAFPVSEVNRGINAFALGVRSVKPGAKIYVRFANSWSDDVETEEAADYILNRNPRIDVLAMHTNSTKVLDVAGERGVWAVGYNFDNSDIYPDTLLTSPVWAWEKFYTPHILECLSGKFEGKNYWDGIDTGLVALAPLTGNVKPGVQEKVDEVFGRFQSGRFDVFYGPVEDQEGNTRIAVGESMSDSLMLNHFDWYVEGVMIYDDKQ